MDVDFVATNVNLGDNKDSKWKYLNPDRMLVRDEFLELLVRLAMSKYYKKKTHDNVYDSLG